jgi:hypothetical protein
VVPYLTGRKVPRWNAAPLPRPLAGIRGVGLPAAPSPIIPSGASFFAFGRDVLPLRYQIFSKDYRWRVPIIPSGTPIFLSRQEVCCRAPKKFCTSRDFGAFLALGERRVPFCKLGPLFCLGGSQEVLACGISNFRYFLDFVTADGETRWRLIMW